jgi:hypothetical protein
MCVCVYIYAHIWNRESARNRERVRKRKPRAAGWRPCTSKRAHTRIPDGAHRGCCAPYHSHIRIPNGGTPSFAHPHPEWRTSRVLNDACCARTLCATSHRGCCAPHHIEDAVRHSTSRMLCATAHRGCCAPQHIEDAVRPIMARAVPIAGQRPPQCWHSAGNCAGHTQGWAHAVMGTLCDGHKL